MTGPDAACRQALDAIAASSDSPSREDLRALSAVPAEVLDDVCRAFALERGAGAIAALAAVAERGDREVRRAARRALYRLEQRGVVAPEPAAPAKPIVARTPDRPLRAWVSGLDGTGARAAWILFEGAFGALRLCSLILSDTEGIADAAGGEISKKRLDRELAELRASQKLPWLETDPARVVGLVAEALAIHAAKGTSPPAAFARWRPLFEGAPPPPPLDLPAAPDPGLVEHSVALLDLPEMAGWFLDPATVQTDAVEMLESRESRLVVSDQIRSEREQAIVSRVLERELTPDARRRWGRRLGEMALIFAATDRPEPAGLAGAAAASLLDDAREPHRHPLARALARRALEVAAEVALGRLKLSDVSARARMDADAGSAPPAPESPRIIPG
jgi:hypothetical protein